MLRQLPIDVFNPLMGIVVFAILIPTTLVTYFTFLVIYRLFFHPLSHIPGPWLPAVSYLPEFYWNGIKDGQLPAQISKWHDKYGPVIRITPDEVHVRDSELYDKLYYIGSKYHKYEHFYLRLVGGVPGTMFAATTNTEHRAHRSIVGPLFSRKAVESLEGIIKARLRKLLDRMHSELENPTTEHASPGLLRGQFNLRLAIRCLTLDVISDYAWGKSFDTLSSDDMGWGIISSFIGLVAGFWLFRMMPMKMVRYICTMPPEQAEKFDKGAATFGRLREDSVKYITKIRDHPEEVPTSHHTLFHEYLQPNSEKAMKRPITINMMTEDGWGVVFAGTDTTGFTIEHAMLGILSQPALYQQLKKDIQEAFPEGPEGLTWRRLEQIPLLTGCVKEALRMSGGVMSRLPRTVEEDGVEFHGYRIPRGSVIGMSNFFMHRDPAIWEEPNEFRPERWLGPDAKSLEKYWAPFSRGQRQCVGMHLGTCEIYHFIGLFMLQGNIQLHPNGMQDIKDIQYVDYFNIIAKPGSTPLLITA